MAGVEETRHALVLVVEDNPDMSRFLRTALQEEYRVETALDGAEGMQKVTELMPDLVISDVMMPEMSGDQLVRAVRSRHELDAIPILMLTAKADAELRVTLLRAGAQDYVMKPFTMEELLARVRNLVIMKRARDVLQRELDHQIDDLEALATEVTSRKRELQLAIDAMRVARDQAMHASRARMTFLSLVSHELRTPLTSLRLNLERLQREPVALTERQSSMLTKMDTSSKRLLDLIEALLHYAKSASGGFLTNVQAVDVESVVGEALEVLRPQAEAKDIALELHVAVPVAQVRTDERGLRLIVMNLVDNALKYSDEGRVSVELTGQQDSYRLRVSDTGPGIPLAEQARVFEPFEQLASVRHKHTPGIGLGLALVREIVDALGGEIELSSPPGGGTIMQVTLPRTLAGERGTNGPNGT